MKRFNRTLIAVPVVGLLQFAAPMLAPAMAAQLPTTAVTPKHDLPPLLPDHPNMSCSAFTRTAQKRTGQECWKVTPQRRIPKGFRLTSFKLTGTAYVWGAPHAFRHVVVIVTGTKHHFTRIAFLGTMSLGDVRHINLYTDDPRATVTVIYDAYTVGYKYHKSRTITVSRPKAYVPCTTTC